MALYALLLVLFVVLADWGFRSQVSASSLDVNHVYCLAPTHLDGLINAAVSLGLTGLGSSASAVRVGNQTLSLTQWRSGHASDFDRVCNAYAEANMADQPASSAQSGGIQSLLDILLPVIAGGLLTMAVGNVKEASDRRWTQAAELRNAWDAFRSAAESFIDRCQQSNGGLPATDDLEAKRRALEATLRKVGGQYRKAPVIGSIGRELAGELGPGMADGWSADKAANSARGKRIKDSLDAKGLQLEKVASALEQKISLARKL